MANQIRSKPNSRVQASSKQAKTRQASRRRNFVLPAPWRISPRLLSGVGAVVLLVFLWWFFHRGGEVTGQVFNSTGGVIQNGQVTLDHNQATHQEINALTGAYHFVGVKPGKHVVSVKATGLLQQEAEIVLKAGQTLVLPFHLGNVSLEQPLKWPLSLVGGSKAQQIDILDADYRSVKKLSFKGRPSDALLLGSRLFVAEQDLSQIDVVDFKTGEISQTIVLPKFSEPIRLGLTQNRKNLVVLNALAKNVMLFGLTDLKPIGEPISLPASPRDMVLLDDGEGLILGPGKLFKIYMDSHTLAASIDLPDTWAHQLVYDRLNQRAFVPDKHGVAIVSINNQQVDRINFGREIEGVNYLGQNMLLLPYDHHLRIFDLSNNSFQRIAYPMKGTFQNLAKSDDLDTDTIIVSQKPNCMTVINLKEQSLKSSVNLRFEPDFVHILPSPEN